MRTREEQIEAVCNLLIDAGQDAGCHATAKRIILEAERRAEQRVRAEIARDSERLDWLEKTRLVALEYTMFFWKIALPSKGYSGQAKTAREAIDAAREVE